MFLFFSILILLVILLIFYIYIAERNSNDLVDTNIHQVWEFIRTNGGNHISHLKLLNDKQLYWAQNKQVLISFQSVGKTNIILGDPIGNTSLIAQAIDEFENYCHEKKKKTAYYQVTPQFIRDYQKRGFHSFKLGEEAKLSLLNFSLDGKKGAKLRTRKNKFERNGYYVEFLFPNHSEELLEELKGISDSWLGNRKEKGFSVGFFCKSYIERFPIAVLFDSNRKAIAFTSLAFNFQENDKTITIDLMRYHKDSPHGTMDMLFISVFNWCKEQGYEWCSLGMAPLANLANEESQNKFVGIGQFIFHKGNQFYNFKGLYEYKNKFQPHWESRYLVYRNSFLPFLILQLIWLIHKRPAVNKKSESFNNRRRILKRVG